MRSAVKTALAVSERDAAILDGQSRTTNWLYNHLLEHANGLRRQYRESKDQNVGKTLYTERGLRDLIPDLKAQHPFLKVVYSSVLKNAALRLSKAIRDYQDGKHGRRAKAINWPTFRAWKRKWFSLQYDEPWKGYALSGRILTLSLGKDAAGKQLTLSLQLVEGLPAWVNHEHIRQCRIVKEGRLYSVVFTVERQLPHAKSLSPSKVVALDPNHKNFAYAVGSDGMATEIHNPYFLKSFDRRSDQLQSKRDRCQKKARLITREDGSQFWLPSRRWLMFNAILQDVLRKRREQTKQFLYTVANHLYAEYDAVGIGNYVPHGGGITKKMRRSMNNRSLNGRFKEVLTWVALRSGKQYLVWEEGGSTRTCHDCGLVMEEGIPVDVREWDCPSLDCLCHHIRDENAARNGLTRTLKALALPCSGRREVSSRRVWRFNGLGLTSRAR
ncbi:MAG: RNA-guided endonuclease InsQ/TnpB family protein [Ktedonobacteraceae bacterium]